MPLLWWVWEVGLLVVFLMFDVWRRLLETNHFVDARQSYPCEFIVCSSGFEFRCVHSEIVAHSIQLHHNPKSFPYRKYYKPSDSGLILSGHNRLENSGKSPLYLWGFFEPRNTLSESAYLVLLSQDSYFVFGVVTFMLTLESLYHRDTQRMFCIQSTLPEGWTRVAQQRLLWDKTKYTLQRGKKLYPCVVRSNTYQFTKEKYLQEKSI